MNTENEISFSIGGTGGAYLLADPGELFIEVEKQDLNLREVHTELRALLVSPDRRVLDEARIPDDGQSAGSGQGPASRVRLSTVVEHPGIYALNITVSQDRYGENVVWGFRTNCPHYLIETARGHKDERHTEPIVLDKPELPGKVCFLPRDGEFTIELAALPDETETVVVVDTGGNTLCEIEAHDGRATHTFPAGKRTGVPWRLELPGQKAVVHIDGVTRWDEEDICPDNALWTPHPESWFPLHEHRWLIFPWRTMRHVRPGEQGKVSFSVHNNSSETREFELESSADAPRQHSELAAERGDYVLSCNNLALKPWERRDVHLTFTAPGYPGETDWKETCLVRVTPLSHPECSTYAALDLRSGTAPAFSKFQAPLVLGPYEHENQQFGYVPDYPTSNQVYFDLENRPFAQSPSGIASLKETQWITAGVSAGAPPHEYSMLSSKIAFDAENRFYCLGTAGGNVALLSSADAGQTFETRAFGTSGETRSSFDIEQFSGHNVPEGPTPFVQCRRTVNDEGRIWRSLNDLELYLPERTESGITLGPPVLVSTGCIGLSSHSGIVSSLVSRGSKVHVVWAEATEPDEDVPGVPTFVATYDRARGTLGEKVFIGYGPPPNDCHNSPSITMDSAGILHVMVGTHGCTFPYAHSLKPNDAYGGWTEAKDVGENLRQTYVGFVCDREDVLHLAFRIWGRDGVYHPHSHYAILAHMKKEPGKDWTEPRPLVTPPFSEYSIFYHRLTIDRRGRLFLSYDYWSTYWFYRNDHLGKRRALMMSDDAGETWKLVSNEDF